MLLLPVWVEVTEQVRCSIEAGIKEAETQRQQLEQKLLQAEKEKLEAAEEMMKALSSLEEQVQQDSDVHVIIKASTVNTEEIMGQLFGFNFFNYITILVVVMTVIWYPGFVSGLVPGYLVWYLLPGAMVWYLL